MRLPLALLLLASPALALRPQSGGMPEQIVPARKFPQEVQQAPKQEEAPWILRWMIRPLRRGIWIRLPVMDTDPNRGITGGIMPIWVVQGEKDDRIREIHAPSLTYNSNFKFVPTYRYYYYPQEDAALAARGSVSKYENEAMGQYEDNGILGSEYDVMLRAQYNQDAGQRFFGFGPAAPRSGEANYKENYWMGRWAVGSPLFQGSKMRVRLSQHYKASRILDGPLPNLPQFRTAHPGQFSDRTQQVTETRVSVDYDTRDHGVTPSEGALLQVFAETSAQGFMSMYDYDRYGGEGRLIIPWTAEQDKVFAAQVRLEQLAGNSPPFWLMPRLGGKYSLRAYGEGRFVDRGLATANIEQRFNLLEKKMAGVVTQFQVAPFAGVGTVYDRPALARAKYARPVFGLATRAVAKPQVVGSVDFGVGQEGLSVFMDINYSF